MFDTAILILLYNKELRSSKTIDTLVKVGSRAENTRLVIWNNGPETIDMDYPLLEGLGYNMLTYETLNNESLSVIYNRFVSENNAKKYVFLDDDSLLNNEYMQALLNVKENEVAMPIIYIEGGVQYPRVNDLPYSSNMIITNESKVVSIGSGLVIGRKIIEQLISCYNSVFDERFYFYGVDTTFCLRLHKENLTNNITFVPGFEHSLSRLENESEDISHFRRVERGNDIGLQLRYYSQPKKAASVMFRLALGRIYGLVKNNKPKFSYNRLLFAFITGRHHKSK